MVIRGLRMLSRLVRRYSRRLFPLSAKELRATLKQTIPQPVPVMFVHSSLSNCGYVSGGPEVVVRALREVAQTLVLPTHTYCYPRPDGEAPIYDAATSASQVGAISDWFWRQPGVSRSIHPTHSVAAIGPEAQALCEGHNDCDTPCGAGTPYEKMIQRDAAVLMFGCSMNSYTLFHTAEDTVHCPYLYYPNQVDLRYRALGVVHHLMMWRQDMTHQRRFTEMDKELESLGLLIRVPLGRGMLLYVPSSAAVHTYLCQKLATNSQHLLKAQ